MQRSIWAVACATALALLAACGSAGEGPLPAASGPRTDIAGPQRAIPSPPEAPAQTAQGLPGLDELAAPLRAVGATTEEFVSIDPRTPLSRGNAEPEVAGLAFDPLPDGSAWALYGLAGFAGSSFPSGARLTFDAPPSEYYVAFPDYSRGRWQTEGPFDGSADVPIVLRTPDRELQDFVSPGGNSYFAVICPPGSAPATLVAVGFGVHASGAQPCDPLQVEVDEGAAGVVLTWQDPPGSGVDLAGYLVERAPQFSGEFAALAALTTWTDYFDATGEPAFRYRYRVSRVDSAGNRIAGAILVAGKADGMLLKPVARIRFSPEGPHEAPATVSYDMSESYDPQGLALTSFEVTHHLTGKRLATGIAGNFVLQPGSYLVGAMATSSHSNSATPLEWMTAYPRWEDESQPLLPEALTNEGFSQRYERCHLFLLPGSPHPWLFGYDYRAAGMAFFPAQEGELPQHRVALTGMAGWWSKPLVSGDRCWAMVWDENRRVHIVNFDGQAAQTTETFKDEGNVVMMALAPTATAGEARYFYSGSTDGETYWMFTGLTSAPGVRANLGIPTNSISEIQVNYDETQGHYDIIYKDNITGLMWLRWGPTAGIVDQGIVQAGFSSAPGIAVNPADGKLYVIYRGYTEKLMRVFDGSEWSEGIPLGIEDPVSIFTLVTDSSNMYLASTRNRYQYEPSLIRLYEFDDTQNWSLRNEIADEYDTRRLNAIWSGQAAGEILVAQTGGTASCRLLRMQPGGDTEVVYSAPASVLNPWPVSIAAGADGLHMLFRRMGSEKHWLRDAAGQWIGPQSMVGLRAPQLARDNEGRVYLGGYYPASTGRIRRWDANTADWIDEPLDLLMTGNLLDPVGNYFQHAGQNGELLRFSVFHTGTARINSAQGGYGYWTESYTPFAGYQPLRGHQASGGWIGLASAGASDAKQLVYLTDHVRTLSTPYFEQELGLLTQDEVRAMTSALVFSVYASGQPCDPLTRSESYISCYGAGADALRYEIEIDAGAAATPLPLPGSHPNTPGAELRRTVSAMTTSWLNGVTLISTLGATPARLDWTGVDGWEQLDLPAGIGPMMYQQLVSEPDGRWHIIYYDWQTDAVLIRSTL